MLGYPTHTYDKSYEACIRITGTEIWQMALQLLLMIFRKTMLSTFKSNGKRPHFICKLNFSTNFDFIYPLDMCTCSITPLMQSDNLVKIACNPLFHKQLFMHDYYQIIEFIWCIFDGLFHSAPDPFPSGKYIARAQIV